MLKSVIRSFLSRSPHFIKEISLKFDRRLISCVGEGYKTVTNDFLDRYVIYVDSSYPIERAIFLGNYEKDHIEIIRKLIQKGGVVVDVGANVGALTIALADTVENGEVHAFEPGPSNFERLENNILANPKLKAIVKLNNYGVGEKNGRLIWREFSHMPGNAGFHVPDGSWSARQSVECPIITLDEYFGDRTDVTFIKIDTEGYEYNVLCGALDLIKRCRPVMSVETLPVYREMAGKDYFNRIKSLLEKETYRLFRHDRGKIFPATSYEFSVDTLCIPEEKTILHSHLFGGA